MLALGPATTLTRLGYVPTLGPHGSMVSHQRHSSSSSPAKATCFIVMSSGVLGLIIFNRGIIPIAYTGIVGGAPAPFVVPSDDEIQLLQVQIGVMTHCINSHALVGINT